MTRFFIGQAYAAGVLSGASIQLSDSRPSGTAVSYTTVFTFPGTTSIKCINIVFAAAADMTGGVPAALTTTSSSKGTISGAADLTDGSWSLYNTANGTLQYENASGEAPVADVVTIPTTGITNTSEATFYGQITTYSTLDTHTCSTVVDQSNVIALVTTAGVTTTVTVSPTISFSVADYGSAVNGSGSETPVTTTSTTVPFGSVAAGATSWGSQTLTVSTNAANGYTLYVRDSQDLTNPNTDTIRDQAGTPGSPEDFDGSASQSSFGYTADGTGVVFGSNKWAGLTQTNTAICIETAAINADATHVEYKVQISNTQEPGTYTTVIIYTATPSY